MEFRKREMEFRKSAFHFRFDEQPCLNLQSKARVLSGVVLAVALICGILLPHVTS